MPKTLFGPKDSTSVDEGSRKQENLELKKQNLNLVKKLVVIYSRNSILIFKNSVGSG